MAKSTDFPVNVRAFGKLLDKFYGHHDYEVFIDFVDYCICCLLIHGDAEKVDFLKKKYGKYYPLFIEMYRCYLETHMNLLGDDGSFEWYDTLGEVYEAITSRSKSSALGQFFTPKPVCDMMAQLLYSGEKKTGLRINDCACGSGRTLLAYNKVMPGNYLYGEDLDHVATKMAAINLAIHGCKGQVSNMDTLRFEWFYGYEINPWQRTMMGLPHIAPIEKHQSFTVGQFDHLKNWKEEKHTSSNEVKQLFIYSEDMKGSDQFKEVIKAHLEQRAAQDPFFAKTYAKENKNLDDCINYILSEVQKSKCNGFADEEIYSMAVHYYDEDDIKPGKVNAGRVVVNHAVAPDAPAPAPKKKPAKKPATDTGVVQTSLF